MKIVNKKAKYDYFLSNNLEVGIVLDGVEVKGILSNTISLNESYVKITNNEVFLINSHIGVEYRESWNNKPLLMSLNEYNIRPRKLLLHKKQIQKFKKLLKEPGSTLILYEIYTNEKGKIKGTLCLAKGKKMYDKRKVIKERDLQRSGEIF